MRAIGRRDTGPEMVLRRLLHGEGRRYRVDFPIRTESGLVRPDIVFTKARLAIFIDGCYWHGCPEHGRVPTVNSSYWGPKLARNAQRDRANTAALEASGWKVLRFWEHENHGSAIEQINTAL